MVKKQPGGYNNADDTEFRKDFSLNRMRLAKLGEHMRHRWIDIFGE
jgi:hypothetical protein